MSLIIIMLCLLTYVLVAVLNISLVNIRSKLKQIYPKTQIKVIGNEMPQGKVKNCIINDMQIYNTLIIRIFANEFLSIGVYTNAIPIIYYFKKEYSNDDTEDIISHVEEYCNNHDIELNINEKSCFDE